MTASASCPASGEVCVWYARTAGAWSEHGRLELALAWLSPEEQARYERYRHRADRDMFLLGRVMARALVGRAIGVAPRAWRWREGQYGRPEISAPATSLSFNLAHSGGVVVCALSRDGQVGTDVEHRQRAPLDARLVRRYCSPSEVADIERQGPAGWQDRFLEYWTLKEAYLKARGLGIAVHLADVSFTLDQQRVRVEFLDSLAGADTNWSFVLFESDGHLIAAAAPAPGGVRPTFSVEPLPVDLLP